jgi:hypothetical protein
VLAVCPQADRTRRTSPKRFARRRAISAFVFEVLVQVRYSEFTFRTRTPKRALYGSWYLRVERRLQPPR